MQLPTVLGHDAVLERFRRSLARNRLASTFLFLGPPGIGKRTTAWHIAQCLLCETTAPTQLAACGHCPGCLQVATLTHPDLIFIKRPEDKSFIPVETFIGDRLHRMREGLCHDIALKPFRGGRKIAIIDDADYLNQEGANCLLKTLEEPPHHSVIILIGTSQHRQLPTIRSRCQTVRFAPLSQETLTALLTAQYDIPPPQRAELVRQAHGSLSRIADLIDRDLADALRTLLEQLSEPDFDSVSLAKSTSSFVDAAGKDAAPRRARLHQLLEGTIDFYRALMRHAALAPLDAETACADLIANTLRHWRGGTAAAAACLERCLEATTQIDANANLTTLIYCWLDDLAARSRTTCG